MFGSVCHIFRRNPLMFRDFYAIRTPIVWHTLGGYSFQMWGVGVVRIVVNVSRTPSGKPISWFVQVQESLALSGNFACWSDQYTTTTDSGSDQYTITTHSDTRLMRLMLSFGSLGGDHRVQHWYHEQEWVNSQCAVFLVFLWGAGGDIGLFVVDVVVDMVVSVVVGVHVCVYIVCSCLRVCLSGDFILSSLFEFWFFWFALCFWLHECVKPFLSAVALFGLFLSASPTYYHSLSVFHWLVLFWASIQKLCGHFYYQKIRFWGAFQLLLVLDGFVWGGRRKDTHHPTQLLFLSDGVSLMQMCFPSFCFRCFCCVSWFLDEMKTTNLIVLFLSVCCFCGCVVFVYIPDQRYHLMFVFVLFMSIQNSSFVFQHILPRNV